MTKTKYLLYAFKQQKNNKYLYWYETDEKYFVQTKPPKYLLDANSKTLDTIDEDEIIQNPWLEWKSNDVQKIISKDGICINYLKSTNHDFITKNEDMKLLEMYSYLVENFDISKSFGFKTIQEWHKMVFETIYPFAGKNRTVNMSKGNGLQAWEWRVEFLNGLPEFDVFLKEISVKEYDSVDEITNDLAKCTCDFLFIHPFREGNGRISRLICDIILAKNGLPMIGLKLKKGDKYLERVHSGYECNYEPMKELLQMKIEEGLRNE
ncbi:Fic/DOC family protein [Sulfurimonas autotrophica]|uniref:protein adenylyltransferase n=1 Tax=Sulfurimonas autotrophica (strain ATCC BAA-671 / DSM 16294 / JCM 11897 / OK10) TaxID=563040 RepID=E0UTU7_SULAO|nr:Fic family protein [Sulfurimonas autotrophica]ADN09391.1 filamentation induced by cAMP protein Fic [Sulfurimonas autotrophica DSM 16294]